MVIFWDCSLTPSLLSHRLYRQAVAQKDKEMKKKGSLQVTSVHRLHHDLQGGEDCAFSIFSMHLFFLSFFSHPRAYWHLLTSIIHNYIHRIKGNGERSRDAFSFIILGLKIPLQMLLISWLIQGLNKTLYLNYHSIIVYGRNILFLKLMPLVFIL